MSVTINGTNGLTFNDASTQTTAATGFGFKNRIINGAMVIDQRNAGAAVTINSTANIYTLDRWVGTGQLTDGVFTVDQTTDAPTGFKNSVRITVTTADSSIGATQIYLFGQFIEGFNVSDLNWGTANAVPVTVSFWTRSSLTGTFGGVIHNSDVNRSYPFTYTINAANTWEQKTITVAGDTTGTWLTDSGRGIVLRFQIGAGSSAVATSGVWTGTSSILGPTGATNIISTLNATWDITGVQLEKGSTATSFDYRPYGTELALCQRYYEKLQARIWGSNANLSYATWAFKVTKRASPTITLAAGSSGTLENTNVDFTQLYLNGYAQFANGSTAEIEL